MHCRLAALVSVVALVALSGADHFGAAGEALAGTGTSFVASVNLGSAPLRNDFTGDVGMQFTVGAASITVNDLCRYFTSGNSQTHTLTLASTSGATLASVSVDMGAGSADANGFKCATLSSGVSLAANTSYYLVSSETTGGDQWRDYTTALTPASGAGSIPSAVYRYGGSYTTYGGNGNSYGPVDFYYTGGSPPAAPLIGAIRWDAWFPGNDTYGDPPWWCCWGQWVSSTIYTDWAYREPIQGWYENTQPIIDQEINWAADRGLDYWAYDWYPENLGVPQGQIMTAFNLYDGSQVHNRMKFSFILQTVWVAGGQPTDTSAPEHYWQSTYVPYFVNKFKDPQYLRVAGNRPVVFWFDDGELGSQPNGFGSNAAAQIQYLRDQTRGQIDGNGQPLGDPYFVDLDGNTSAAATYGFSAISRYSNGPGADRCYSSQASVDMSALGPHSGFDTVAALTAVDDPRPRSTDPSYPAHGAYGGYTEEPTYGQWESHLKDEWDWLSNHPGNISNPGLILTYAWNELDEGGGGIVPTNQEQFKYLDAIKAVKTGTYPSTWTDRYNTDACGVSWSGFTRYFPANDGAFDNDYMVGGTAGDYESITVANSVGLSVTASKGPNRGKADVYLDNVLQTTVDLYSASYSRGVVYTTGALTKGTHTLKLVVSSSKNPSSSGDLVVLDSFDSTTQR